MKHNIRQRVINEYGLPVTKIESVTGELGSKMFDKNGVEIFEGDIISNGRDNAPVKFHHGGFYVFHKGEDYALDPYFASCLEVIGHVDD